ncbi:MAG: hypothetical protein AB7S26_16075 [Sandaracinaceae bacterium]
MLRGAASLLGIATVLVGCEGQTVGWRIEFEDPADRAAAVFVVARLREGGCAGPVVFEGSASRGAQIVADVPTLRGPHGVEAVAIDAGCAEIAHTCEVAELDALNEDLVSRLVAVDPPRQRCAAAACMAGSCAGCGTSACGELGDACNALAVCAPDFECGAEGTCTLTNRVGETCAMATPIALSAASPTVTTSGTVRAGANPLGDASCVEDSGMLPVALFDVSVDAGAWDLVLSTEDPLMIDLDTILYLQRECGDRRSELACNDDDAARPETLLSHVEVLDAGGDGYTVVVQDYDFEATAVRFDLVATLRPIRASSEACDPAQVLDRCAGTPCPATGVCP